MLVILQDVRLRLKYDRCFCCGCILICHCDLLLDVTTVLSDVVFMLWLLEAKVAHLWKRTGPRQCHRVCLACKTRLCSIKRSIALRSVHGRDGRFRIPYHREGLPEFLSKHNLGDWRYVG